MYLCLQCTCISATDVDECLEGKDECHDNATCTNTVGAYNCTCKFGFEGDGLNCTGTLKKNRIEV